MKIKEIAVILGLLIGFMALAFLSSCTNYFKNVPADSWPEEIVEQVIDQKLGVDLDLSPYSKENTVK